MPLLRCPQEVLDCAGGINKTSWNVYWARAAESTMWIVPSRCSNIMSVRPAGALIVLRPVGRAANPAVCRAHVTTPALIDPAML